ncbi:hypothetical protein B0J17DRAFT_277667 [Rhizoctonia solani]|nr:hypothetical protein B0J17DRAFT_277667 [Rhizoctonia solani]
MESKKESVMYLMHHFFPLVFALVAPGRVKKLAISAVPLDIALAFFPFFTLPLSFEFCLRCLVSFEIGMGDEVLVFVSPLDPEFTRFAVGGGDISTISELLSSSTSWTIILRLFDTAPLKKSRLRLLDCSVP